MESLESNEIIFISIIKQREYVNQLDKDLSRIDDSSRLDEVFQSESFIRSIYHMSSEQLELAVKLDASFIRSISHMSSEQPELAVKQDASFIRSIRHNIEQLMKIVGSGLIACLAKVGEAICYCAKAAVQLIEEIQNMLRKKYKNDPFATHISQALQAVKIVSDIVLVVSNWIAKPPTKDELYETRHRLQECDKVLEILAKAMASRVLISMVLKLATRLQNITLKLDEKYTCSLTRILNTGWPIGGFVGAVYLSISALYLAYQASRNGFFQDMVSVQQEIANSVIETLDSYLGTREDSFAGIHTCRAIWDSCAVNSYEVIQWTRHSTLTGVTEIVRQRIKDFEKILQSCLSDDEQRNKSLEAIQAVRAVLEIRLPVARWPMEVLCLDGIRETSERLQQRIRALEALK